MDTIDEWMKRISNKNLNESSQNQPAGSRPGFQQTQNKQPQQPQQARPQGQAQQRPQQARPQAQQRPQRFQQARPQQSRSQQQQPRRPQGQQGQRPGQNRPAQQQRNYGQNRPNRQNRPGGGIPNQPKPHPLKTPLKQFTPTPILRGKLKIMPLGGLDEVGKNMMALEYEEDILIIDMGLEFPSEDMLGIDYVIPDVSYLENNKKRIRGVVVTHGHLDHIGGVPYILPKLDFPPIYGTKLTLGLIQKKVEEFKQQKLTRLMLIDPDKPLKLGQFLCNFIRVSHSIPDAVAVVIDTPVGKIVHTGDFKFDETPAHNQSKADIHKMEALGGQNVLALFCESTNALKPGHSLSEKRVGEILEEIVRKTPGRIIIASFSSQIGRIQQIIDAAVKNGRKIFVSGRSMKENIDICARLGYIKFPPNTVQDIKHHKKTPDHQTLILTTGSQGEAVSALARIAAGEHTHVKISKGDTIILSSSPIPGNEKAIHTVINNLTMLGADVIHNEMMDVHTSGHGKQDELMRMINYVKPKYLVPIHGEFYMRKGLQKVAIEKCNIPEDKIIMLVNGDVLIAENGTLVKSKETIETKYILIDGLGEGHIGSQVQMDREIMSENGALIVLVYVARKGKRIARPADIVSRGFIYMHESEEITREIGKLADDAYRKITEKNPGADRKDIKKYIRQTVDRYTHNKIERRPLIVPLIIEM